MAFEVDDGPDSERLFSEDEERRLTENLLAIQQDIEKGIVSYERLNLPLLVDFHYRLFAGVRGHAGKLRNQHRGTERLIFGGHRSCHRDDVERELMAVFERLRRQIRWLLESQGSTDYEREAIRVAAVAHADVVRIHPFEDGNGRTSRLLMDCVLVILGLPPIPILATKDEYYAVMDAYIGGRDSEPLLVFYVDLLVDGLSGT